MKNDDHSIYNVEVTNMVTCQFSTISLGFITFLLSILHHKNVASHFDSMVTNFPHHLTTSILLSSTLFPQGFVWHCY